MKMAIIAGNTNITLNGTTDFAVGATTFSWDNGWIESVDIFSNIIPSSFTVNVSLTGSGWAMGALRFNHDAAVTLSVTINDDVAAGNRWIDFLQLNANNSTVTLTHTGVGS